MNMKEKITPDILYDMLPDGNFYIENTFNLLRNYSPTERFPKPKYDLYELLSAWYQLIIRGRVLSDGHTASKK
jgi:hypothetical protein